ncbi:GYF domain-containing protein [Bradyrhizobium quebecense]|uniref:GYF domain-containing protein n=2 Tax=Bradyrhizobium quebecense TaxID=2748629 RepID=A0ACD3VKY3_9BRAD|nr:GYF domain-containing protein [Bradyrhizobium quebecense]UGY06722.1 GYF domain-containing protein [Bradyrhizobium quebecense]
MSDSDEVPANVNRGDLQSSFRPAPRSDAPPHPLDGEWHIHINGETYGPYTGHRFGEFIKEGRVDGSTQVLPKGSENWTTAAQDRRLAPLFKAPSQKDPPPITAAAGATVVQVTNQIMPSMLLDDSGAFGQKSAGLALFLSFLICGAGQMYCGRVGKGILMLIGCIALWIVFLGWTIWIWSMIDAYMTAKDMNLRFLRRLQAGQAV